LRHSRLHVVPDFTTQDFVWEIYDPTS